MRFSHIALAAAAVAPAFALPQNGGNSNEDLLSQLSDLLEATPTGAATAAATTAATAVATGITAIVSPTASVALPDIPIPSGLDLEGILDDLGNLFPGAPGTTDPEDPDLPPSSGEQLADNLRRFFEWLAGGDGLWGLIQRLLGLFTGGGGGSIDNPAGPWPQAPNLDFGSFDFGWIWTLISSLFGGGSGGGGLIPTTPETPAEPTTPSYDFDWINDWLGGGGDAVPTPTTGLDIPSVPIFTGAAPVHGVSFGVAAIAVGAMVMV